jgi:hypothetical protein
MTWIAGKAQEQELLGLGSIPWLNGERENVDELTMYLGGERAPAGAPLKIPAVIGTASSQVEGDPIVDHGPANAKGKLIKVYFPPDFPGQSVGIFH